MSMSDGYLLFGKTILCRKGDAGKYKSIADINRPEVKVMVNPAERMKSSPKHTFRKPRSSFMNRMRKSPVLSLKEKQTS